VKFRVKNLAKFELEVERVAFNDNIAHLFLEDAWFGSRL
jgi:hypothetical protein